MTAPYIALLRGINVGAGNRIAMADLRRRIEALGCSRVRTWITTGNVVLDPPPGRDDPRALAAAIADAVRDSQGRPIPTVVLTADELRAIIAANPLPAQAEALPARLLVAFPAAAEALGRLRPLTATDWTPEALALGPHAAYLWCPSGISVSPLALAFDREARKTVTTRNWATVRKLEALASDPG